MFFCYSENFFDYGVIMKYFWAVILQIVLIALNAIFASAEIAVISMNETRLNALAQKGGKNAKKAKKLTKLTADPARFLSTIQVAITLAGFLGSAFAADLFAEPLAHAICNATAATPKVQGIIEVVCVVVITIILAFFNIVFGELVPKRFAQAHAESVSTGLSGILGVVSVVFRPIVFLLSVSTNGVLKLLGVSPDDKGDAVTEEDILMMAEAGTENGSIEDEENEMIKNIFEFSDLTIGEICTHRKDAAVLFEKDSDEEWDEIICSTNHTYYPVCGDGVDDITGILYTKAYFRIKERTRENIVKNAMLPPVFLYENAPANVVFEKMKKTHDYFAVVIDEYGGMAGIVTIHDLLEAIVGDMDDKGEEADYSIEKVEENVFEINGVAPLDKVEEELGIKLLSDNEIEHETFSGYVCGILVSLPEDGSQFELETEQLYIHVLTVEKQCITKIRVQIKPSALEREDEE